MIKHPKHSFGIFEDGHTIRIVHLMREKDEVFLMGLDRVELDNPLYHQLDNTTEAAPDYDKIPWEKEQQNNSINLDEYETEPVSDLSYNPFEAMLSAYDLKNGVIALNINDDNLIKCNETLNNSRAIKKYAKANLSADEFKQGEWQYSEVQMANASQIWFHHGPNQLLELLQEYRRKSRMLLYYQLSDANDIAITDYFRIHGQLTDQQTILVYLGHDYRKVFIFKNGLWSSSLPLQISQHDPEPDIVYSKIALALDSEQEQDPERIVICGDLASTDLAAYLHQQYSAVPVEMLGFSQMMVDSEKAELYDSCYLAQYAMPIALAYKALFPDYEHYTPTNFLPSRIVESQKVFKIAWHGFIVLALIFLMVLISTVSILKVNQDINREKIIKRELDFTLAQRRKEAAEIQRIRTELENQEKIFDVLKTILEGKNPWTEVLDIGNRIFSNRPTSWLANLKLEKDKLFISGVTTRRAAIIDFANAFPNSQIKKVTYNKIRNQSTWAFEIVSDFPVVDWMGAIEKDFEALRAMKAKYGEETEQGPAVAGQTAQVPNGPVTPVAPPRTLNKQKTDSKGRIYLSALPQSSCPVPREELLKGNTDDVKDYKTFVLAANKGNVWDYRDLGVKYLSNHASSELAPAVRWWLCYRMYLDKDYNFAQQYLEPMLRTSDRYYPYALLLQARVDYMMGNPRYKDFYKQLKNDYARHSLSSQVAADLAELEKGGAK